MLVRELMKHDVKTCRPEDTLGQAAEAMWAGGCGCLPVIDEARRVVAIVTDRDLCMATCRDRLPPESTPVSRVASRWVAVVSENACVEDALALMRRNHIRRLPVVDREERPVGILSLHDIAKIAHWAGSRGDRLTPESVVTTEVAIGQRSETD